MSWLRVLYYIIACLLVLFVLSFLYIVSGLPSVKQFFGMLYLRLESTCPPVAHALYVLCTVFLLVCKFAYTLVSTVISPLVRLL